MIEISEARCVLVCSLQSSKPNLDALRRYFQSLTPPSGRILDIRVQDSEPQLRVALEFESSANALSVLARLDALNFESPFGCLSVEWAGHGHSPQKNRYSGTDTSKSQYSVAQSEMPGKSIITYPKTINPYLYSNEPIDGFSSFPNHHINPSHSVAAKFQPEGQGIDPRTQPTCGANFEEVLITNQNLMVNLTNYLFQKEGSTRLMYVQNLNSDLVKPSMYMNLFCCFGNVQQLLIDRVNANCLVQYSNSAELAEAVFCLNGRYLFDRALVAIPCPDYYVKCHPENFEPQSPLVVIHGTFSFHRYQSTLNIKYNRPTSVLHLTNIPFEVDHVILFMLIAQVQEPRQIIRLNKTDKKGSPMYLAVFENSNQAIEVLAVLHNKVVQDRSVKASFTAPRKKAISI
jgi:hypothetical protein